MEFVGWGTHIFWLFHAVHDAMIAARNVVAKHRTMPGGDAADSEQSAPQVLERLVEQAERAGASDIHLHMRDGFGFGRLPARRRDDAHG